MEQKLSATACVLIGGESSRFGSPKWKAKIQNHNVLDIIWNTCENFENRFVVGKEKPSELIYPYIQDELPFNAPLNGLYTALKHSKTQWIFLISCDLPLVTSNTIFTIWNHQEKNLDAIVPKINGYLQPTCAFFHKRIIGTVESIIKQDEKSLYRMIKSLNFESVIMNDRETEFTNMNTMSDYQFIQSYIQKQL